MWPGPTRKPSGLLRKISTVPPCTAAKIEGIGPRYCPSLEDKIVRFADKPRHQVFIEPCGLDTEEMYLQGMSSSLPEEVQLAFYRSVEGMEQVEMMRCAYAIEYDCVDPLQPGRYTGIPGTPRLIWSGTVQWKLRVRGGGGTGICGRGGQRRTEDPGGNHPSFSIVRPPILVRW